MRFHRLARRIFLAPALALVLAAAITACSSSGSSSNPGSGSTPAATGTPTSAPATSSSSGGSAATIATIKSNWEKFFSGSTPTSERVSLLQNGQTFEGEITSLSALGATASATVSSVTLASSTLATVRYTVNIAGKPVLPNAVGSAVYENGTWKVGDASFCSLLTMENNGKAPSVCSSSS
jgi:hypothetical protein